MYTYVCARSITVTRPRRSSFSSDEHKSPVMTDRCRSDPSYARPTAMPATARKCQGVGEALRKNSSPRIDVFMYTRIGASRTFCRCQRRGFMTIDVLAVYSQEPYVIRTRIRLNARVRLRIRFEQFLRFNYEIRLLLK